MPLPQNLPLKVQKATDHAVYIKFGPQQHGKNHIGTGVICLVNYIQYQG